MPAKNSSNKLRYRELLLRRILLFNNIKFKTTPSESSIVLEKIKEKITIEFSKFNHEIKTKMHKLKEILASLKKSYPNLNDLPEKESEELAQAFNDLTTINGQELKSLNLPYFPNDEFDPLSLMSSYLLGIIKSEIIKSSSSTNLIQSALRALKLFPKRYMVTIGIGLTLSIRSLANENDQKKMILDELITIPEWLAGIQLSLLAFDLKPVFLPDQSKKQYLTNFFKNAMETTAFKDKIILYKHVKPMSFAAFINTTKESELNMSLKKFNV